MSSTLFSNASPFAAALPMGHTFFAYDADGDAIMTDAVSGLPITYGGSGSKRSRSASLDSDSTDSRPSKRSRMSSDDDEYADMPALVAASSSLVPPPAPMKAPRAPREDDSDGEDSGRGGAVSPIKIPRAPVGLPDGCPPAPKKAPRSPRDDDADGDGHESALRNLAEQMAAAVLDGEPREDGVPAATEVSNAAAVPADVDGDGAAPPGGEPERGWCVSVTCSDLALRLDMRHPRVVLNFLRFVDSYNELAPEGEDIHLPTMGSFAVNEILGHESVMNPAPEFAADIAELRARVAEHSCHCPDCEPEIWSDHEYDDDDSDSDDSYFEGYPRRY